MSPESVHRARKIAGPYSYFPCKSAASTEIYAARLQKEGHAVTLKMYPDSNHGFFNFPDGADKAGVQKDIVAFLAGLGIR